MTDRRQLHLNAFLLTVGHHEAAWRVPESNPADSYDIEHYKKLARLAERGTFDSIFFADGPSLQGDLRYRPAAALDPLVLLPVLATVTERLGLVATASTTYNEPYNLARKFASIDHLSNGRVGWNIVTTAGLDAAQNFGRDEIPSHRERYERAAEFVDVCLKLWDSWDDDYLVGDKSTGVFADDKKVRRVDHVGKHFKVRGPLNVPRSPQGRPLLVQAGSSDDGRAFAGRFAEAVFTAQQTLADGQSFYADVKAQAARVGRNPDHVKILPGLVPVIGSTEEEAHRKDAQLASLQVPAYGLRQLSQFLGTEVTEGELDAPLRDVGNVSKIEGHQSRTAVIVDIARRDNLTVRELLVRLGGGRGHRTFAGTPEQIANTIEEWFRNGAADGFNVMAPVLPSSLELFVEHVIPLLRKRGLFRQEYTGKTLRDHYGLPRAEETLARDTATAAE